MCVDCSPGETWDTLMCPSNVPSALCVANDSVTGWTSHQRTNVPEQRQQRVSLLHWCSGRISVRLRGIIVTCWREERRQRRPLLLPLSYHRSLWIYNHCSDSYSKRQRLVMKHIQWPFLLFFRGRSLKSLQPEPELKLHQPSKSTCLSTFLFNYTFN